MFSISLQVTAGEALGIEPFSSSGGWQASSDTDAIRGDYYLNPKFGVTNVTATGAADDFRTYVTVATAAPEPATLALLGAGLTGLILARRRKLG